MEDDDSLGATLKERLSRESYLTRLVNTVQKAYTEIQEFRPDLIILDVGLPDGNGFEIAREIIRYKEHPPFLFLTANAGAKERLEGFEIGAEEFIPKPFHLKELLIRVHHVLETHQKKRTESKTEDVFFGNCRISFERYEIETKDGKIFSLQTRDCELLKFLIQEKHRAVSRSEILDRVWGEEKFPTERTIDNSIVRLRKCFGKDGHKAIQSVRGIGYRFTGVLDGKH